MQRFTVHFSGRVQGVNFRANTVDAARDLEVAGFVQNLSDGRVRLVAEGETDQLDQLIENVQQRMGGNIREHTVDVTQANGEFGQPQPGGIGIRY